MKADRLLSALLLLQANRRLTGREMAERLEVSERTVHRDMEALSASGVPVFALRGARGGWQLDEDWRTEVPGLDEAELEALLMAQPRVVGHARLAHAAERAIGKLIAALPAGLRDRAASIRERLYVDPTAWRGAGEDLAMLPAVQDAVSRDRKLVIRYRKPDGKRSERTVDPLGLVAKGSAWYLFAGTRKGFRTFRVSRIEETKLLDQASERPADFDLAAAWRLSMKRFAEERPRYHATLRLEPGAAKWLKRWRDVAPLASSGDGDEPVDLRVQFEHEEEACFVALGLGSRAEVIAPESLRLRVEADLAAAMNRRADNARVRYDKRRVKNGSRNHRLDQS